jgi:hypothetical protein
MFDSNEIKQITGSWSLLWLAKATGLDFASLPAPIRTILASHRNEMTMMMTMTMQVIVMENQQALVVRTLMRSCVTRASVF